MEKEAKMRLAQACLPLLSPNMVLGLGSGSTLEIFVEQLMKRLRERPMSLRLVSSSDKITEIVSARVAEALMDVQLLSLEQVQEIDLTIDGLDYVNLATGLVLKGNGGALYLEKKLALKSRKVVLVADERKLNFAYSPKLIVEFSPEHIAEINDMGFRARPELSDSGNLIVECPLEQEQDIFKLRDKLVARQGYLDDGDFSGLVDEVWIAYNAGEIKKFKLK